MANPLIYKSKDATFLQEEPLGESLLEDLSSPFRVWIPKSPIIVLGRSQKAEEEIFIDKAQADGIPIFRRYGGGGCVFLDKHSVCVGIRYNRAVGDCNVEPYFAKSSALIQQFFNRNLDLNVNIESNNDLTIDNRKFLGASLYMPKGYALYLCVILVDSGAMGDISKYLKMPSKVPDHRVNRSHEDFLTSVNQHCDVSVEEFCGELEGVVGKSEIL